MTHDFLIPLIQAALVEDIGSGDITSELLIPKDAEGEMAFVARQPMVVCGVEVPELVYLSLIRHPRESGDLEPQSKLPEIPHQVRDDIINVTTLTKDGQFVPAGTVLATAKGDLRVLLAGERTALNIMQRMSGVATLTKQYVDAVAGTQAKILDTRKTMPSMRFADKYAVRCGGGVNHRMGLYDAVLVKDNHVAKMRDEGLEIKEMVDVIRKKLITHHSSLIPIIVECDTIAQLREVLPAKPDRILLDNMSLEQLREAVAITAGSVPLEASGGVNLSTIRAIAETGVGYISVGAITHSAPAVDIGLDIVTPT